MFSELVDEAALRAGRPDRKADIKSWANSTIRECVVLAYFARDMVEDTITADAAPYIWTKPNNFRLLRTAKYPSGIYPKFAAPGKRQDSFDYFYYGGPTYFVFAGVDSGSEISVAYYAYPIRLKYYDGTTGNERPAIYDRETETWTYWNGTIYVSTLGSTALDEAAQTLVTNWILQDWYDLGLEGTMAKLFKSIDDKRAGSTFGLYKSFQKDLKAGEVYETMGV